MKKMRRYVRAAADGSDYEPLALELAEAIKDLARSEDALNNFVSYLTYHFPDWCRRYANTPENLVDEFRNFADMYN